MDTLDEILADSELAILKRVRKSSTGYVIQYRDSKVFFASSDRNIVGQIYTAGVYGDGSIEPTTSQRVEPLSLYMPDSKRSKQFHSDLIPRVSEFLALIDDGTTPVYKVTKNFFIISNLSAKIGIKIS